LIRKSIRDFKFKINPLFLCENRIAIEKPEPGTVPVIRVLTLAGMLMSR
jgi:hypothetical protein